MTAEMSFTDRLAQLRAQSCENLPTPELAVLTRTTARLRRCGMLQQCLQVGETAPDFSLGDQRLYALLEQGPVIINFFRGFWCAFCRTELEAFAGLSEELSDLNCHYVSLSPQPVPAIDGHPYLALHDVDNVIARQFGIVYSLVAEEIALFERWGLDLDPVHGANAWELPLPATYVIAPDRCIAYAFVDADFRARCCPEELATEIRRIAAT